MPATHQVAEGGVDAVHKGHVQSNERHEEALALGRRQVQLAHEAVQQQRLKRRGTEQWPRARRLRKRLGQPEHTTLRRPWLVPGVAEV